MKFIKVFEHFNLKKIEEMVNDVANRNNLNIISINTTFNEKTNFYGVVVLFEKYEVNENEEDYKNN